MLTRSASLQGHAKAVICVVPEKYGIIWSSAEDMRDSASPICTGSEDQTARIWDCSTSQCMRTIQGFPDAVTSVAWYNELLYVSSAHKVFAYDLRQSNPVLSNSVKEFGYNTDEVNQICLNSNGTKLAACDDSGAIQVIDVATGHLAASLQEQHSSISSCVCFRPNLSPEYCISGGLDCTLLFWDCEAGRLKESLQMGNVACGTPDGGMVNPPFVNSVCASADGRYIAAGLGDGTVSVYTEQSIGGKKKGGPARKRRVLTQSHSFYGGHTYSVSSVAFLPTKPEISIEETLAAIELTDKSKPLPHQQLQPSLLGPVLVSGGNDKRICIWDLSITSSRPDKDHLGASRSLVAQFQHSDKINMICAGTFSKLSRYVGVADTSPNVTLYTIGV